MSCIPTALLTVDGYFPRFQPQVQSLAFNRYSLCAINRLTPVNGHLTHVTDLSWKGLLRLGDFTALRLILHHNSKRLTRLHLDLVSWRGTDRVGIHTSAWERVTCNFFADSVLNLHSRTQALFFPSLRSLCLSGFCFCGDSERLAAAFNLNGLRHLKILRCLDVICILDVLSSSKTALQLTSFELVVSYERSETDFYLLQALVTFLNSFVGLQELCLLLDHSYNLRDDIWAAINHHSATLKRLVFHCGNFYTNRYNWNHRYLLEEPPVSRLSPDFPKRLEVEYLGISLGPQNGVSTSSSRPYVLWKLSYKLNNHAIGLEYMWRLQSQQEFSTSTAFQKTPRC
jgi:hypothetical protein